MESFPRFERKNIDAEEKIRSLKTPFVHLFQKMRSEIMTKGFDAIVSDDTGARIPTLIFREVYKKLTGQHPQTLFIASGASYFPRSEEDKSMLKQYLEQGIGESKRVVFVTQYIHSGDTVKRLVEQLQQAGYSDVTVAALEAMTQDTNINLYVAGTYSKAQNDMTERHQLLSAVAKKTTTYSPVPLRMDDAIERGELKKSSLVNREEYNEFVQSNVPEAVNLPVIEKFEMVNPAMSALDLDLLTEGEKNAIQNTINHTRALVQDVADSVVAELLTQGEYIPTE